MVCNTTKIAGDHPLNEGNTIAVMNYMTQSSGCTNQTSDGATSTYFINDTAESVKSHLTKDRTVKRIKDLIIVLQT